MNENPCGDVGGPDKDNPRICTYPDGHAGRHSFDAPASRGGPATIGLDRLPRITADCSLGIRPSIEDTWWLIAQMQIHRAREFDAPTPRCPIEKLDASERCVFSAGHDGTHSWEHYWREGQ